MARNGTEIGRMRKSRQRLAVVLNTASTQLRPASSRKWTCKLQQSVVKASKGNNGKTDKAIQQRGLKGNLRAGLRLRLASASHAEIIAVLSNEVDSTCPGGRNRPEEVMMSS
jgi:hypothetical protein